MTHVCPNKVRRFLTVVSIMVSVAGCNNSTAIEFLTVSIRNTEQYEHLTVGGDEEGARISAQARHYSISEVRRGPETNWIATYVYRPSPGFVGTDNVELEVLTGSDGATAPNVRKVRLHFVVRE